MPFKRAAQGDSAIEEGETVQYETLQQVAESPRHRRRSESMPSPDIHSAFTRDAPPELTSVGLACLSASLLGSQLVWSVEYGYGTPFLLSLGLSKQAAALIWLAAPVTGLIGQPLIGAISDAQTHNYRRRKYIILSAIYLTVFALCAAYSHSIAYYLVTNFGNTKGAWDPKLADAVNSAAVWVAIPSFWCLDLSLNFLQATSRALVLDTVSAGQQSTANAWQARLAHVGNIIGYSLGFTDLSQTRALRWIPGNQFAKLVVCAVVLNAGLTLLTCLTTEEQPIESEHSKNTVDGTSPLKVLRDIKASIVNLPKPIQHVCLTQFFSWIGWFTILFFTSSWVAEVYGLDRSQPDSDNTEAGVRAGSLALLYQSLVALASGILLPFVRNLPEKVTTTLPMTRAFQRFFTLRNVWAGSQILFAFVMFAAFNVTQLSTAMVLVSLIGVCWAVSCWVPFALVMEMIHQEQSAGNSRENAKAALTECRPLLQRSGSNNRESSQLSGATILGIHNLSIVLPQFLTSIIASLVFQATSLNHAKHTRPDVVYVFLIGACSALVAAALTRTVPVVASDIDLQFNDDC